MARPSSRAEQVAQLSTDYLLCRGLGHAWGAISFGYGVVDRVGVEHANHAWLRLECDRCGMQVERHVDPWFALTGSTYATPDGYAIVGQGRGNYRAEARRELLARFAGPPPQGA